MNNIPLISALVLCVLAGRPVPARAQIYSWQDANGILTLSDRPQDGSPRSVKVPVAPALAARSEPEYEPYIQQHSRLHGVRAELVRAVIQVESAFNPRAVSPKGAMGLMQLMPATARELGVIDPFDPAENIRGGVAYLRQLLDRYKDDVQLALAAYNAGPGAVDKYGAQVPPYKETRKYVAKIAGLQGTVRNGPEKHVYRVTEMVNGRAVVKYTNTKPESGDYEEVTRKSAE